jgi:putative transposase
MSQSLARLRVHGIQHEERWTLVAGRVRVPVNAYLAAVLKYLYCPTVLINPVADHVQPLALGRTVALSTAVEQLKQAWSKWIKTQGPDFAGFAWQAGYGVASVSESNLAPVRRYIARQPAHHRVRTFEDEIRALLERHGVAFDERNVCD